METNLMIKKETGKEVLKKVLCETHKITNITNEEINKAIEELQKQVIEEMQNTNTDSIAINSLTIFNIFKCRFGIDDKGRLKARKEVGTLYFASEDVVKKAEAQILQKLGRIIINSRRNNKQETEKLPGKSNINIAIHRS